MYYILLILLNSTTTLTQIWGRGRAKIGEACFLFFIKLDILPLVVKLYSFF